MILKTTYYKPSTKNVQELIYYLRNISGISLKLSCLRQNIFKVRWSERDVRLIDRCQIQSAISYLEDLIEESDIEEVGDGLRMTIAEIAEHVHRLDPAEDTSFILVSTNTLPSTIHYKHASELFYQNSLNGLTNKGYDSNLLVLYILRLALEKRIMGILGIDSIENNRKPLGVGKILPMLKVLKNVQYSKSVEWQEISWVYDWLNHHMHRYLRPYPWVIHQSFEVLNPLLLSSELNIGERWIGSFYASTIVKDEGLLQNEIENWILQKFPQAEITWSKSREILRIDDL